MRADDTQHVLDVVQVYSSADGLGVALSLWLGWRSSLCLCGSCRGTEALDGALDEVLAGMLSLEPCPAGLAGLGLVLLHLGLGWLVLFRVTSLSLFARICTRFLYRWT